MSDSSLVVSMKGMQTLVSEIHPSIAVCVRGRHAVGKSEGIYQAASKRRADAYRDPEFCARMVSRMGGVVKHATGDKTVWTYDDGLPVMERRLSQMTEGDTIGLPFSSEYGTVFKACDWLIMACDFPMLVFLDERNRALDAVKQSVFQLCDSKAFYGNRLNDESTVVIAENVGGAYQVQSCDPAEVSRCATVTLDPSQEEWLTYARSIGADKATLEFVRTNRQVLEFNGNGEPDRKYPDRRSWIKLDKELRRLDLFNDPSNELFYWLAGSMLGVETGSAFTKFCKDYDRQVSAEDILKDWKAAKKRLAGKATISNEMYMECVEKVGDYLDKKKITKPQVAQIELFTEDLPSEIVISFWSAISKNHDNLQRLNNLTKYIVKAAQEASSPEEKAKPAAAEESDSSSTGGTRGRRAR